MAAIKEKEKIFLPEEEPKIADNKNFPPLDTINTTANAPNTTPKAVITVEKSTKLRM